MDTQHTRPVAIGRENRVAEEVFASERTEASLQRTLCAYARDRGRQRRQQTDRDRGLRLQHAERIVAVQPDNRRQYHRITPLAEIPNLGSQRLEVLLMVEDAGYVGRAHLARVLTYALQIGEVDTPEAALDTLLAELLGYELGIEIQKPLDVDDADLPEGEATLTLGGHVVVYGKPRGLRTSDRAYPVVIAAAVARYGDASTPQQIGRSGCITAAALDTHQGIWMFGRLLRQALHGRYGVIDSRTVGHVPEQVERPG